MSRGLRLAAIALLLPTLASAVLATVGMHGSWLAPPFAERLGIASAALLLLGAVAVAIVRRGDRWRPARRALVTVLFVQRLLYARFWVPVGVGILGGDRVGDFGPHVESPGTPVLTALFLGPLLAPAFVWYTRRGWLLAVVEVGGAALALAALPHLP